MHVVKAGPAGATVELSATELVWINNALNEICNGVHIEDWEFPTRLGWSREELRTLLEQVNATVKEFDWL